jgi:ribosome modulation factor
MTPYDRGYQDYQDGKSRNDCPYVNISAAMDWESGWDSAYAADCLREGKFIP